MAQERTIIATQEAPEAIGPYSQAIKYGNLLFLSGQIPLDPATGELKEGIEAQTKQALANVEAVLKAGGSGVEQLLEVTIYLTDISHFALVNQLYESWLGEGMKPARAVVEVAALPKGALIEVVAKGIVES